MATNNIISEYFRGEKTAKVTLEGTNYVITYSESGIVRSRTVVRDLNVAQDLAEDFVGIDMFDKPEDGPQFLG